jgi:hypothetical protein
MKRNPCNVLNTFFMENVQQFDKLFLPDKKKLSFLARPVKTPFV